MADVEFHVPTHEPTFIKPLDAASRRRSRASHDSVAASTRSWVLMNQQSLPPPAEPIPVPDPIPALAPTPSSRSRPLPEPPRRTSGIVDSAGNEHMTVDLPKMGYEWTTGRGAKAREANAHKGFVGGFVSGLRRLPRALVRTRRPRRGTLHTDAETEGTEGTGMTGNTLPQYVSNPTTPVVPNAGVAFAQHNADAGRRRHPSFRIVPPEEDEAAQQGPIVIGGDPQQERGGGGDPSMLEFPQTPLENPYDRETASVHGRGAATPAAATSPRLSRADDHLIVPSPDADTDEPVSVQAHPLPTEDYRRMSAADAAHPQSRTTLNSTAFTSESPSFSTELNGIHRFFNALHGLPWIAAERITADYVPKLYTKPAVSWYHPKGESAAADAARTRDVAVSAASPASPPSPRSRSPPRHRHHRRTATLPDPPASAPPATYGFPVAYSYYPAFSPSPRPPSPPTPPTQRRSPPPRSPSPRHTHRAHRHRRRSTTYHAPPTSPILSMPAPWVPAPPAPVYIIQASPAPTPSPPVSPPLPPPPQAPSSSTGATTGSMSTPGSTQLQQPSSQTSPVSGSGASGGKPGAAQMLGLAPVYMQMQVVPAPVGGGHQLAFVPGGDARYPYGYASPYSYPYPYTPPHTMSGSGSGGGSGRGYGSPIAMPLPAQTGGG
ncbi:hypothetical protein K438DRAFT_948585 [Mycena galopus ATCC 62051]|nr:hypothetical protein K438DRAFT_948585 [Mycena galopus ATCC 62051]